MRFLIALVLTAVLSFIAGLFLPWWSIAVVSFVVALWLPQKISLSFLSGLSGIFILWLLVAAWIDSKNESMLSHKIAQLFPLGGSSFLLLLITAFIGGIVGGFAAMSGASLRPLRKRRRY